MRGGNSGVGSFDKSAEFKTEIINGFLKNHPEIESVIDIGCGDGEQLKALNYKKYLGLDVSPQAISICIEKFNHDKTKSFTIYDPKNFINNNFIKTDLVVCLDVLYHITDEKDFLKTLEDLFSFDAKYIILYTTQKVFYYKRNSHIIHREVMPYLHKFDSFFVTEIIEQKYKELCGTDFVFLEKRKNL
jgi:2-polyprenyl-3-methyl-5-hydroxy-6-metoxy-1,4-benzoquinol methylase